MPETLAAMQRAMLARLLGSDAAVPALCGSADAPADQRLAIHVRGYGERLRECLALDFPALRALVGAQVFDLFATGYLAHRPSRSRSLYDLGAGFADYLAAGVPTDGADPFDRLPAELARLERARTECHRARGPEEDHATPDSGGLPFDPSPELAVPDTVRLVRSSFDLAAILDAAERGDVAIIPVARPSLYAVARMGYRVRVHVLTADRFAFVERLQKRNLRILPDAISSDENVGETSDLLAWIPRATTLGIVQARRPAQTAAT